MIRNASHNLTHRRLGRLPTGTHVALFDGSVWLKWVRAFMPAGWIIPKPLRPTELAALNSGLMPTVLLPAHNLEVAA